MPPGPCQSTIEYPHDATRAITSLLFSGSFSRLADIRFIFSHGGGTAPTLAARALATLVPISQILFGSDYPYGDVAGAAREMSSPGLSSVDLEAIGCVNALTLFARFKKYR